MIEVTAYKRDQITVDLVCCDLVLDAGDGRQVWTVDEDMPGFDDFMTALAEEPGFRSDWREAVIQPPFAENRTLLLRRARR